MTVKRKSLAELHQDSTGKEDRRQEFCLKLFLISSLGLSARNHSRSWWYYRGTCSFTIFSDIASPSNGCYNVISIRFLPTRYSGKMQHGVCVCLENYCALYMGKIQPHCGGFIWRTKFLLPIKYMITDRASWSSAKVVIE